MKALVVLSGGQDSTTCLALAVAAYGASEVAAVTFNYGQRHILELEAARNVAKLLGVADRHEVITLGDILKGTSPLTDPTQELELYESFTEMDKVIGDRVEKTFVPMRNALFLTLAANRAVVMGAAEIWTGVCEQDNANYPDCRLNFINSQERTIDEALGGSGPKIRTPLIMSSKAESIRMLMASPFPGALAFLAFTHTAYDGQYPPTSKDHASLLRAQGFIEAGVPDPLVVRAWMENLMWLPGADNYTSIDSGTMARLVTDIDNLKKQLQGAA